MESSKKNSTTVAAARQQISLWLCFIIACDLEAQSLWHLVSRLSWVSFRIWLWGIFPFSFFYSNAMLAAFPLGTTFNWFSHHNNIKNDNQGTILLVTAYISGVSSQKITPHTCSALNSNFSLNKSRIMNNWFSQKWETWKPSSLANVLCNTQFMQPTHKLMILIPLWH